MNEYIKINPVGGSGGSIAPNSITGNDITLGSFATGSLTVVDYTNLIGTYFEIQSNPTSLYGVGFYEGSEWTASVDNDTTALSIATAINTSTLIYPYLPLSATALLNVITVTALVKSELLNCHFNAVPTPYLTAIDMTGGIGDFTIPGFITGNYEDISVRGNITSKLGSILLSHGGDNIQPRITFVDADPNYTQGIYSNGTELRFSVQLIDVGGFINNPNTDETCLLVVEGYGGGIYTVAIGANDSGGTGYRMLRILNK